MKRSLGGLVILLLLLPAVSFAQTSTHLKPPASWMAFQKEERAKRTAFFKQMKAERQAFLFSHPDVKAYLDQMHALAQARMAAKKAAETSSSASTASK